MWGYLLKGMGFFLGWRTRSKIGRGDCTALRTCRNHWIVHLNGWIAYSVNDISIQLFKKKKCLFFCILLAVTWIAFLPPGLCTHCALCPRHSPPLPHLETRLAFRSSSGGLSHSEGRCAPLLTLITVPPISEPQWEEKFYIQKPWLRGKPQVAQSAQRPLLVLSATVKSVQGQEGHMAVTLGRSDALGPIAQ